MQCGAAAAVGNPLNVSSIKLPANTLPDKYSRVLPGKYWEIPYFLLHTMLVSNYGQILYPENTGNTTLSIMNLYTVERRVILGNTFPRGPRDFLRLEILHSSRAYKYFLIERIAILC